MDRLLGVAAGPIGRVEALESSVWDQSGVPPTLLSLCRVRVHQLLGCPPPDSGGLEREKAIRVAQWPTDPVFDGADRACLALTEQFVIDAHGVEDGQTEAVAEALSTAGLVALVVALGLMEGACRLQMLFAATEPLQKGLL